ncbi:unnamed protein product [Amoebophrya sp. A120]|nr:unnamed protein product [Amoebophrya sp. A120]|eukprot:GSA120T00016536001.1
MRIIEERIRKNDAFPFVKKSQHLLIYYLFSQVPYPEQSCRPWTFSMTLKAQDGVEFAPGVFAATSEDVMKTFLGCIRKFQEKHRRRQEAREQKSKEATAAAGGSSSTRH